MRLADLAQGIIAEYDPGFSAPEVEVRGLTADSRAIEPGFLFAALPGWKLDGRDYIPQAVAAGAVAVLVPADTQPMPQGVAVLASDRPRRAFARMAARFYGAQPGRVAAVTGTNGKTSTAVFFRQMWSLLGANAASMGTLGLTAGTYEVPGSLTTPDPVLLHRLLAEAADKGVSHLCMEASSHGLDQSRLDGVALAAAAFTNLTRDHLDYHGTVGAYLAAKQRLFTEVLSDDGIAVLNADVPEFTTLRDAARAAGKRVWSYGTRGEELRLISREARPDGQHLVLSVMGAAVEVDLPLAGTFQAMNALAALGLVIATGADPAAAAATLNRLQGVPGRMELAGTRHNGATVYVDYAHTPDALETVLQALRPHAEGRLVVLFGCGGDRDPGKRPMMGEIAARLADAVIVTDDNPRSEDPMVIRDQILEGCPEGAAPVTAIGGRRDAIRAAVADLRAGDVLLLAGKGHETGQIVAGVVLPFDDRIEARFAIEAADSPEDFA